MYIANCIKKQSNDVFHVNNYSVYNIIIIY